MTKKANIFLLIVLLIFTYCESTSPRLEGILLDNNKKSIEGAKIHYILWKDALHSEEVSSDFFTTTDINGRFYIDLKDVRHLDFVVESTGFYPFVKKGYVPNIRNKIEILLNKTQGDFSAISSFDDEKKRLKIGVEKDFSLSEIKDNVIKDSIIDSDLVVWLESEDKTLEKIDICMNSEYGILPIYNYEIKNSIYWELIYAPTNGYKTRCEITGKEIGFFLKSKKGYAKLILNKDIISGTRPQENGYIKFKYYSFDWIFNPNNNDLSVSNSSTDKLLE